MTKYLLLKFRTPSHWISCHHLLTELELSYHQAFGNIVTFELDLDEATWEQSCLEIASHQPDVIIFADHRIRVPLWVHFLKKQLPYKVSWAIHAYGCFSGRVDEWMQLAQLIPNDEIKILSGSETHTEIIRQFFLNPHVVETLAFPYQEKLTGLRQERRLLARKNYQLSESDLVFTYAGRISYQKNVHHLINLFNQLASTDKKIKLFIAGQPDDKNPRELPHGYYLNHAAELFQLELSTSKLQVTYLQQLSSDELHELYQASDYAVSFSTLYGEDYGRSLIEGLSTGLGVIATRWGGHKDLASLPQVKLIDVVLENENLKLDLGQLESYLKDVAPQDHEYNIQAFKAQFGHDQAVRKLQNLYQNFTSLGGISREAVLFDLKENNPWKGKEFFNLHEKILQPYWK